MSEHRQPHRSAPPTPSGPAGESGDGAARRPADETETGRAGDTGPEEEGGGRFAKRQRPGLGREEQTRPYPPGSGPRPERESDDR
ncbi:hypothetical protein ACFY7H_14440 [Streptomyces sp. NPDC012794]|uniref:hypothetical protein n=1 Tax=Streptomyces sp. NPDC012794 TaxID=3364850 RepID=UPI0036B03542